jgi:hypothetical protein
MHSQVYNGATGKGGSKCLPVASVQCKTHPTAALRPKADGTKKYALGSFDDLLVIVVGVGVRLILELAWDRRLIISLIHHVVANGVCARCPRDIPHGLVE